ncbi:protease TldD [Candidatus Izimaplasma bacterium HR1]|jgi:TldD protein|uniref:TldD/PmbA family protein n=1 Tax=Candidatus Izimoplasma sp. HR1 TaxID=1541959 RepID=UPI0004F85E1D|nr:protease TldD [Candidatus Izimaplasma bacterium HR1]
MYKYPEGLYIDVRIEDNFTTRIVYKNGELHEQKVRSNKGAFIRVYDGLRWYYASLTDLGKIQEQIDTLAKMATPNEDIENNPVIKLYEVHNEELIQYKENSLKDISLSAKDELVKRVSDLCKHETIKMTQVFYVEDVTIKEIYTSKGSNIKFDKQTCGIAMRMQCAHEENNNMFGSSTATVYFDELKDKFPYFEEEVKKNIHFIKNAVAFEPGEHKVLMSPLATGVFTHESFGHKSESDFMVGDETMRKEWVLGKKVGPSLLTIIDDGTFVGNGYVPFDDEGTKGSKTNIITNGVLTDRLHSVPTAAALEENLTGNARSINFEYEPIVRMTTTYIEKGDTPLDDIIKSIDYGVFIDTIKHGSGMSTFTIAPSRAYLIENGKITTPIKLSVITGNVFETLDLVDAVSKEFELLSFVGGGCGKMEQFPLPVGFGGPYTLVRKLNVM